MAIKMRENKNKGSVCEECLVKWNETKVMYDLMLIKTKTTLCSDCTETLFKKILTMLAMIMPHSPIYIKVPTRVKSIFVV